MFLIFSFAFSLTCRVGVEPLYPNYQDHMCKTQSLRGPASIKPLSAGISRGQSRKPETKRQKHLRKLLTSSKDFNGIDLNGNGKKDVKITYNSKGYKKISYSLAKNGKFNQFSVYNPSGRLIKETVDINMDGQVDYFYECKDNVCETRSHYQEGKPNQVVRTTYLSGARQYELMERKDGQLQVVEKNKVKDTGRYYDQQNRTNYEVVPDWITEGKVCYNCYDENRSKFTEILKAFKDIQEEGRGKDALERYHADDAFFVSQTGYLIHEECFDKERNYGFDVEKTLVDTLVQVFDKLLALEESLEAIDWEDPENSNVPDSLKELYSTPSMVVKSHIPRLLHLFDKTSWENSRGSLSSTFVSNDNGKKVPRIRTSQDPCREFTAVFDTSDNVDSSNCHFNAGVEQNRPKLFCTPGVLASEHAAFERYFGYASNPNNPILDLRKKDGLIHLYGGSNAVVKTDGISKNGFKTLFTHEMFHNLGYYDPTEGEVPYPDTCVGAVFYEELSLTRRQQTSAEDDCFRGDYHRHIEGSAYDVSNAMERIY